MIIPMNGAAPSSSLMQSIRTGFQQQGSFGLASGAVATAPPAAVVTPLPEAIAPLPDVVAQPVPVGDEPTIGQTPVPAVTPVVLQPAATPTLVSEPAIAVPPTSATTSVAQPAAMPTPVVAPPIAEVSPLQEDLDVLDQVLTEVEQAKQVTQPEAITPEPIMATPTPVVDVVPPYDPAAQVMPQVISQATDTLNVGYARPTAKESVVASQPVEVGASLQYVETEKTPEIPVEVESYIQRVEEHPDQLPPEIVIADDTQVPLAPHYAKQPVIVLPITPEVEAEGAKKGPVNSIRWLVEFSRKVMKMFTGKVIYRDA